MRLVGKASPDQKLWKAFKQGDPAALESIFTNYFTCLFDYGLRMIGREELVRDGIQDVFAYLWERRGSLSDVRSIKSYLIICLKRSLLDKIRKQSRMTDVLRNIKNESMDFTPSFEDLWIAQDNEIRQKAVLRKAFQEVPERMREALYLKTFHRLTYKEIAEVMEVRPQVARNYVCDALKRLKDLLHHPQ